MPIAVHLYRIVHLHLNMIRLFADSTGSPNVPAQKKPLTKIHVAAEVHRTTMGQKQYVPSKQPDCVEEEGTLDSGEELLKDFMD